MRSSHFQSLEQMPHTYLMEVPIIGLEICCAVRAFEEETDYQSPSVFTTRWDHVLLLAPGQRRSVTDNWINFRLDEIVHLIHRDNPEMFAPPEHHLPQLQQQLARDRASLRTAQAQARPHFVRNVRQRATMRKIHLPHGRQEEFAEWVYQNPNCCPGLRLYQETDRELMANYMDVPETGDFSDLAHVCALPYVGAATFDRRMRHYCGSASRNLLELGCVADYRDRIYPDLGILMQMNPRR
jgi:hypothetical protein